jgi:hypothetical protein
LPLPENFMIGLSVLIFNFISPIQFILAIPLVTAFTPIICHIFR